MTSRRRSDDVIKRGRPCRGTVRDKEREIPDIRLKEAINLAITRNYLESNARAFYEIARVSKNALQKNITIFLLTTISDLIREGIFFFKDNRVSAEYRIFLRR